MDISNPSPGIGPAMNHAPTVEIMAIGTELVMGRVLDTNTHWLEGQIVSLGGHVRRAMMVEDDRAEIVDAVRDAIRRRTELLITTGGLGPTPDDVTAACIAEVAGTTCAPHDPTLDDFVRRRNLKSRDDLTPNLIRMATVPVGATVLQNPAGWAPCCVLALDGTTIFVMPGPPREVEGVFTAHVAPVIARRSGIHRLAERVTVDLWESELAPVIEEVMRRFPGSYLKGYVAMRTAAEDRLPVDVVVSQPDPDQAAATLQAAIACFEELLRAKGKTVKRGKG